MLIDVSLPGMNGIQLVRTLHQRRPDLALAMLSGHGGASHVRKALQAGARGYILKGSALELPDAIRAMASGATYLSSDLESFG